MCTCVWIYKCINSIAIKIAERGYLKVVDYFNYFYWLMNSYKTNNYIMKFHKFLYLRGRGLLLFFLFIFIISSRWSPPRPRMQAYFQNGLQPAGQQWYWLVNICVVRGAIKRIAMHFSLSLIWTVFYRYLLFICVI